MAPTAAALALARAYCEAALIVTRTADELSRQIAAPKLVVSTCPASPSCGSARAEAAERRPARSRHRSAHQPRTRRPRRRRRGYRHRAPAMAPGPACTPSRSAMTSPCRLQPGFAARHGPFTDEIIAAMPLILEDDDLWTIWLRAAGSPGAPGPAGSGFDDAAVAIEAAASGLGVALIRRAHGMRRRRAAVWCAYPTPRRTPGARAQLVWRADSPKIAAIRRFADWMLDECRDLTRKSHRGPTPQRTNAPSAFGIPPGGGELRTDQGRLGRGWAFQRPHAAAPEGPRSDQFSLDDGRASSGPAVAIGRCGDRRRSSRATTVARGVGPA